MQKKLNKSKSNLDSFNDLANYGKDLPPLKKILGNFILENSLILNPSERGTGKTFFGMEICIAVANCFNSFCGEKIQMYGNTLFINNEVSRDVIARRLAKLYEKPPEGINHSFSHEAKMYTTRRTFAQERNEIISIIKDLQPILVFIDNFKTSFRDTQGKPHLVGETYMELLELKDDLKFSLVIIDHTKKGTKYTLTDSDLQSGSGTKTDLADSDFFLRRSCQDSRYRILKRVKSRNTEEQDAAKLLYHNPETLWFECLKDSVDEAEHLNGQVISDKQEKIQMAKELREKKWSYDKIANHLGIPKTTIFNGVKKR